MYDEELAAKLRTLFDEYIPENFELPADLLEVSPQYILEKRFV